MEFLILLGIRKGLEMDGYNGSASIQYYSLNTFLKYTIVVGARIDT